ncbi:hypothetical protein [Candidatus Williamhamiltonella defendens]|uniref:hypothetical protein n=1 Tax=Candidatus Williamhamiltonella defendens TaxID=138072 RepID=UPI001651A518|nr:hypothetical protein [Candidatus Hamiltonella defensa]
MSFLRHRGIVNILNKEDVTRPRCVRTGVVGCRPATGVIPPLFLQYYLLQRTGF